MANLKVYLITGPNGKVYIGQTKRDLDTRWRAHCKDALCNRGYYLHGAIRKYGFNNFKIELLGTAKNQKELDRLERSFIIKFDAMNPNKGYNLVAGGLGGNGWWKGKKRSPISAKHAERLHASRRGVPLSMEHKIKLSKQHLGMKYGPEFSEKQRQLKLGSKLKPETICKRTETLVKRRTEINLDKMKKIVELQKQGLSDLCIACHMGICLRTLRKWYTKYKNNA